MNDSSDLCLWERESSMSNSDIFSSSTLLIFGVSRAYGQSRLLPSGFKFGFRSKMVACPFGHRLKNTLLISFFGSKSLGFDLHYSNYLVSQLSPDSKRGRKRILLSRVGPEPTIHIYGL